MSLRARKKERTRREISDVATRLFAERGFERVTLVDIADEAEVSVKTIFNHFGSKEDLFFDRMDEFRDGLVTTITRRPEGTTVLGAMRELLTANLVPFPGSGWDGFDVPERYEEFRRYRATEARSPALRARRAIVVRDIGEHLEGVVAAEFGRNAGDVTVRSLVAMLLATMTLRDAVLETAVLDRCPPAEVRRRVIAVVDEAFARLGAAYGDVDRPAAILK